MRIIFMGTPAFAVPSLRILLEQQYEIAAVVTAPDKPAGRGQLVSQSAVKQYAQKQQLNVVQPSDLTSPAFVEHVKSLHPDLAVVVAFRILPPELFTVPGSGSINLHASLLPKYRGAAPINWAIIRGERETGVTTFFLKEVVDTGNIILQARVPIGEDDTAGELHDKLADVGAEIVLHSVRLIERNMVAAKPQDESAATPAPKIYKDDCMIRWKESAREVHNFIRGLSPKPCAFTYHHDTMLKLYASRFVGGVVAEPPGTILETDDRLLIGTGSGAIEILEIQQQGKKRLATKEFLRGYALQRGEVLPS